MNSSLLLRMAVTRLLRFRLQTTLLALGMIVSICATVLVLIALANMRDRFEAYFGRLFPADTIVLESTYSPEGGVDNAERLQVGDVEAILGAVPDIIDWDPLVYAGQKIINVGPHAISATILGNSERAEHVRNRAVTTGEFISAADVRSRAKVALIGTTVADVLFPGRAPLGEQIAIDGVHFTIKGVLESVGADPHGNNQDDFIQVPYTTLMQHVEKIDYLSGAMFVLADRERTAEVVRRVSDSMRELTRNNGVEGRHFNISTPKDMQRRLDESFRTVETFVAIAATAGYVLSGVVILIGMLMSVKARTAEIGLRKAVGARRGDVQWQILFEATIVAVTASLLGLLLAQIIMVATAPLLQSRYGLDMDRIPVMPVTIAVCAAVVTAILSALLPAKRAAALDPMVALRQL